MTNTTWPLKQLVEVEWIDSCSDNIWGRMSDHLEGNGTICKTAGYLLRSDRKAVQIAQNQSARSTNISDVMTIPKQCVTKIRKLK